MGVGVSLMCLTEAEIRAIVHDQLHQSVKAMAETAMCEMAISAPGLPGDMSVTRMLIDEMAPIFPDAGVG